MARPAYLNQRTIPQIVRMSAATIYQAFKSNELTLAQKAELASKFIVKRVHSADVELQNANGGNKILIYVSTNGDGKDLQQVFSAPGAEQNSRLEETV